MNPKAVHTVAGGLFITFEGLDGTGKSTQARRLARYLERLGYQVVHTREPGGTPAGRRMRAVLLRFGAGGQGELSHTAELLLMVADRAQHVAQVIRPALEAGAVVLCERFSDSTLAYQAFGLGLARQEVAHLDALATGGLRPHLTVWFDLPVEARWVRRGGGQRRSRPDRIESRDAGFFARVREGYGVLAAEAPDRVVRLDVTQKGRDEVFREVLATLRSRLATRLSQLVTAGGERV